MPYPGPAGRPRCRRPLPARPRPARRRPRARLRAGLDLRGERPRRHPRPVAAHRADHREQGRADLQGGRRRRQPARVAAADHRQPAVGDDRPRSRLRARRPRRPRPPPAASASCGSPACRSRSSAPTRAGSPARRRSAASARSTSAPPSRRSSRRASTPSCSNLRALRAQVTGRCVNGVAAADGHVVGARHQRARQGAAGRPRGVADGRASSTRQTSTRRTSPRRSSGSRASTLDPLCSRSSTRSPTDLDPGDRRAS